MKSINNLSYICIAIFVTACASPKYAGTSISHEVINNKPEVNIIEDAKTKKGFLAAIEKWLSENGYKYSVKPDGSSHDLKTITIEYIGYWKWDLALFLGDAKIEAFYNGQRVGEVTYNAPNNFNTNKFSDAEERIEYMLEILFGKISAIDATKTIKSSK